MGITPIASLIPLPASRAIQAGLEPLPMERVENSARTGDETYSPGNRKSGRGSEDGADDNDTDNENDNESEDGLDLAVALQPPNPAAQASPLTAISFFA